MWKDQFCYCRRCEISTRGKKTSTKTCPEVLVYETWYLTKTKSASVVCVSQMRQESLAKNKSADYAVKTDLKKEPPSCVLHVLALTLRVV